MIQFVVDGFIKCADCPAFVCWITNLPGLMKRFSVARKRLAQAAVDILGYVCGTTHTRYETGLERVCC